MDRHVVPPAVPARIGYVDEGLQERSPRCPTSLGVTRPAAPDRVMRPGRSRRARTPWPDAGAEPVWAGRAAVRAPRSEPLEDTGWVTEPRGRWWMPIVVGAALL